MDADPKTLELDKDAPRRSMQRLVLPLRVWWIPQVPMDPFHVEVEDIQQARKILDTLAAYDLFQLENNVKPDFCNAGGLETFEDGEWLEWESADGDDIDSVDLGENAKDEASTRTNEHE